MHKYLFLFLSAFGLSFLLTPAIRHLALKYGMVALPRDDRWHKEPTAILGGIGIYLASILPCFFIGHIDKNISGLFLGATFLFVVGLVDDNFHIAPYAKLFIQIISGCIAVFFGIILGLPVNSLFAIPLTLLWVVGVTNSFNLLDNIDGLAAGIAAISSFMLFLSSLIFSNNPLGIYAIVLSGAALGFLPYNFNPAKIFMGDSGSMFLGYSLAVISIAGTAQHISNLFVTILIPVLILSVPIFDTIFVMMLRKLEGRSIFEGGKDHTSHHLVMLGLSPRKTVLLLYAISIAFGLIAVLYARINTFIILVITALSAIVLLFFGLFLSEGASPNNGKTRKYASQNNSENSKTILSALFLYKRRIVEVLLDCAFICMAYYSAYFLRFEGELLSNNIYIIKESLVWIILIKMSVFFIFGLYRGVWRYISIADLITIFKVTALGSIVSVLFLTFAFRFQYYSRAVFFLDWMLLLFLVSGSRVLFRLLGEFFNRIRKKGDNILIFGAGDTGEMVVREIKRNKSLNYNAFGFIDDDPAKIGNKIQGIPVLGSRDKIKDLVSTCGIKEIIIAIPSIEAVDFYEITKICEAYGLRYRRIKGILDKEDAVNFGKN